jgi:hypothetical protein
MRLVADVEAVRTMPAAVRQRERPNRDRQRLERRRPAVARRLPRQHARDIGFHRERRHRIAAAGAQHADAQRSGVGVLS